MPDPVSDQPKTDPYQLIQDIDRRQDEALEQIDQLALRIESTIGLYSKNSQQQSAGPKQASDFAA